MGIDLSPSRLRRSEGGVRFDDGLGDLRDHLCGVGLVLASAETERHRPRSRMGVGRGNEDALHRECDLFSDDRLDRIADIRRQHARIDDTERHGCVSRTQHEGAGVKRIIDTVGDGLEKTTVANRGEFLRRDVDRAGSGFEWGFRPAECRGCEEEDEGEGEEKVTVHGGMLERSEVRLL